MIRNTNIKRGYLDLSDLLYLDPAFDRANASKRVQEGDVVIARSGLPGAAAVVPDTLDRAQTFTTLVVRPLDGVLDPDFLVLWINSRYGRDFIASMQGGGVLQNMNATLLTQLPVRVPPLSLQRAIADSAAAIEAGHKAILGRIDATAELARTVQRKAFGASE